MQDNDEHYRRITDVHGLETRVRLLEDARLHLMDGHNHHEVIIDKLEADSREMVTALKLLAQSFVDFKSMFKVGFRIISIGVVVFIFIAGTFLKYSHDLDTKYEPKFDKLVTNSEVQKLASVKASAKLNDIKEVAAATRNSAEQQRDVIESKLEDIDSLQKQLDNLKKLKAIKASK